MPKSEFRFESQKRGGRPILTKIAKPKAKPAPKTATKKKKGESK